MDAAATLERVIQKFNILDVDVRQLVKRRLYIVCVYAKPKEHEILTAERNQPGLSRQEWEERQLELSRQELSRLVFDNVPIIQEHMGNDPWVDEPTIDGSARMEAGRVFEQYQDPNDGSMYVGMRCLDGTSGHWLCRNMESTQGTMHGISIGHTLFPDGRIRVDEISFCWKGKRAGTGLVKSIDYEYPPELNWEPREYKGPSASDLCLSWQASEGSKPAPMATPATSIGDGKDAKMTQAPPPATTPASTPATTDLGKRKETNVEDTQGATKRARTEEKADAPPGGATSEEDEEVKANALRQEAMELATALNPDSWTPDARKKIIEALYLSDNVSSKQKNKIEKVVNDYSKAMDRIKYLERDSGQSQALFIDALKKMYLSLMPDEKDLPAEGRAALENAKPDTPWMDVARPLLPLLSQASAAATASQRRRDNAANNNHGNNGAQLDPHEQEMVNNYRANQAALARRSQGVLESNLLTGKASAAGTSGTTGNAPASGPKATKDVLASYFAKVDTTSGPSKDGWHRKPETSGGSSSSRDGR